jgi:hypothetical protein
MAALLEQLKDEWSDCCLVEKLDRMKVDNLGKLLEMLTA